MPALIGEIIDTIRDGAGNIVIQVVIFYDPVTRVFVNGSFTTSAGPQTGAVIVDNQTSQTQQVSIKDAAGTVLASIRVKPTDRAFSVAQINAAGFASFDDVNGFTFDLV